MKLRLVFTIISILFSINHFAFPVKYSIEKNTYTPNNHFINNDVLNNMVVCSMYEDSDGFIWLAAENGVARFDGGHIKRYDAYDTDNQFGLSTIHAFSQDAKKRIWMGGDNGICYYNPLTDSFHTAKIVSEKAITVNSILKDSDDRIWLGTTQGLFRQNLDKEDLFEEVVLTQDHKKQVNLNISCLIADKQHNILIGTIYNGLLIIDHQNTKKETCPVKSIANFSAANEIYNKINCLVEYPNGDVLIGTESGLYSIKADGTIGLMLSHVTISAIAASKTGQIWVATRGKGLVFFKDLHTQGIAYKCSNTNNKIQDYLQNVYLDTKDCLWIMPIRMGVNRMMLLDKKLINYSYHTDKNAVVANNLVKAIEQDQDGTLYFGTYGGITVFDQKKHLFYNFEIEKTSPLSNNVDDLAFDTEGNLWLGTKDGLYLFDKKNESIHAIPPIHGTQIWTICPSKDQESLWVASLNGLYRYNYQDKTHQQFFNDVNVISVYEDRSDRLWVGTDEGLFVMDLKNFMGGGRNQQFTLYQHSTQPSSLSHNTINTVFEASDHSIWIGTLYGLNKFNEQDSTFIRYNTQDGLSSNIIKGIAEDCSNNLWITTHNGITVLNPQSNETRIINTKDGINNNVFNLEACIYTHDHKIVTGSIAGFTFLYPDKFLQETSSKQYIYVSDLFINNQEIIPNNEFNGRILTEHAIEHNPTFELRHNENTISINLSTIEHTHPEFIRFAYRIKSIMGNEWIYLPDNVKNITLANLEAGDYCVEYKSTDASGKWCQNTQTIRFVISPHWSKTTFAKTIYWLLALLSFFAGFKYFLYRIERKEKALREKAAYQHKIQLEEDKLEFFTNISHEIRTPVTLIAAPIHELKNNYDHLSSEQRKYYMELIHKNVQLLIKLIDQLLSFRKLEHGKMDFHPKENNLGEQIQNIVSNFHDSAKKRHYKLMFSNNDKISKVVYDTDIIEKVTYNLLSNAFKYTPDGGCISVDLAHKDRQYLISVKDTGIGIEKDKIEHIFTRFTRLKTIYSNELGVGIGLAYVKSLVELHGAEIKVESQVGKGSCFTVIIPDNIPAETNAEKENMIAGKQMKEDDRKLNYLIENNDVLTKIQSKQEHMNESANKQTLLIVEDNTELQTFLVHYFKSKFNVLKANNGKEALSIVYDKMPEIIITDVIMPEMNGLEFASKIKSHVLSSHIPIIILTAKSATEHELEGLKSGADYYLRKPFNPDQLDLIVENLLNTRKKLQENLMANIIDESIEMEKLESADEKFTKKVYEYVKANLSDPELTVEKLATEVGMSNTHLYRKMKALFGVVPNTYIKNIRMKQAADLLTEHKFSVSEVAYATGFNDPKYFSKCFKQTFGVKPSEYKIEDR